MKRVFALLLCVMLVVACFSGCIHKESEYKYLVGFDDEGNPEYEIFRHRLGDLSKLKPGKYPGTIVSSRGEEPGYIEVWMIESELLGEGEKKMYDIFDSSGNRACPSTFTFDSIE